MRHNIFQIFLILICGYFLVASPVLAENEIDISSSASLTAPQALFSDAAITTAAMKKKKKRKKKIADSNGVYIGSMVLTRTKSFKGFNCSSSTFPAQFTVTPSGRKVSVTLDNFPAGVFPEVFKGPGNKTGFKAKASIVNNFKRSFVINAKKVVQTTPVFTFTETVKSGKKKACIFTHKGSMIRTPTS